MTLEGITPPPHPVDEQAVAADLPEFDGCREALDDLYGKRGAKITDMRHTYSETWGYVLRATVSDVGPGEEALPPSTFLCWKRTGEPGQVYVHYSIGQLRQAP